MKIIKNKYASLLSRLIKARKNIKIYYKEIGSGIKNNYEKINVRIKSKFKKIKPYFKNSTSDNNFIFKYKGIGINAGNKVKIKLRRLLTFSNINLPIVNSLSNVRDILNSTKIKVIERLDIISKKTIRTNKKVNTNDSYEQFIGLYYGEHELFIIPMKYSNHITIFTKLIKIDIPTEVVGDSKVENIIELSNIIENVISVLNLRNSSLILLLSSSGFTARSFKENEIGVFSVNSPDVLAKSPFLPKNTIISYSKTLAKDFNSFYRVVYAEKESLNSWKNVLQEIDLPIASISTAAFQVIQAISEEVKEEMVIVADIEKSTTSIFLQIKKRELFSTRLPFGSSLYTSDDNELSDMYFYRLSNSIKQIVENNSYNYQYKVYVFGTGFDNMVLDGKKLTENFYKVPSSLFNKYKLDDQLDPALGKKYNSLLSIFSNHCEELVK